MEFKISQVFFFLLYACYSSIEGPEYFKKKILRYYVGRKKDTAEAEKPFFREKVFVLSFIKYPQMCKAL